MLLFFGGGFAVVVFCCCCCFVCVFCCCCFVCLFVFFGGVQTRPWYTWYKGFKHSRFTNVTLPCSQPLFNMAEKHVKYSGCRSAHKMSIYLQIIQLSVKSLCCAKEKCINLTSYLYHNVEIKLLHPLILIS